MLLIKSRNYLCFSILKQEVETEDNFAVGNLIKGTALRELGRLDAASECLGRVR